MFFFGSRYHKLLEMRPIREGLFASEDQWLVQRYFLTEIVPFLGAFYVSVQGCIYRIPIFVGSFLFLGFVSISDAFVVVVVVQNSCI